MNASHRIVYPGTFDPITKGHENLIKRAAMIFPEVVVAVAVAYNKHPMFCLEERIDMAKCVLRDLPNVTVTGFDTLLGEFMEQAGATLILRGLRAVSDFEYEFQMAGMNRRMTPDMDTIFLTPDDEYMFVSSTIVREIAFYRGNVLPFVSTTVAEHLKRKVENLRPAASLAAKSSESL